VKPLGFSSRISTAIRHHHERWDGSGYPDGFVSADIPLPARIIAVADAFDAMTCDRPYRARMTVDAAVRELRKHAGSQFDPHLVEEFIEVIESGAVDTLDDGSPAGTRTDSPPQAAAFAGSTPVHAAEAAE
jgi:HD-GYP domain-containing protein (c-di-GMP phosphodiesterase class II)